MPDQSRTLQQAEALAKLAASRGLVLAEAFHWRHHPLARRVREVVRSGELGRPVALEVSAGLPTIDSLKAALGMGAGSGRLPKMDVLLGGGNFMGQGCYAVDAARFLLGEPVAVLNASSREDAPGPRTRHRLTSL